VFFCTLCGANGQRALAGMRAVAELLIDASALNSDWSHQVHEFAQGLGAFAARAQKAANLAGPA
jgi:hypothetical protein